VIVTVLLTLAAGVSVATVPGPFEAIEAAPAMEIVGEEIREVYASPSPYPRGDAFGPAQLVWSDVIHFPDATYICPHFGRLELGAGDFVVVRSPDGSRSWRYEGAGVDGLGRSPDGFWGIHIAGDTAVVELWTAGEEGGFGYVIDRFARGFTRSEMGGGEPEAIIGVDDSEWAPCYETSEPIVYDKGRAVARLLINGSGLCTGWLVGNEGHLMTNNHCISTQGAASNTNYEFMAEGADCSTNCWQLQCPGAIVTTSGTLIDTSYDYDYALVQLSVNPSGTYGYFTLRPEGGTPGERLYIPQHPMGWGKKIAVFSSHPSDPDGWPFVVSKSYGGCGTRPGPDMGYRADTQGGSSGSPVLSYDDHQVIALHHCGSTSINTAVLIEQVIADLGPNLPASAIADPAVIFQDDFEDGTTSAWALSVP
jgi:hypothetical protein